MNNKYCKCRTGCTCPPPPKPKIQYQALTRQEFERQANALARSFCPDIFECKKCGSPYVEGYVCSCGDGCPHLTYEQEEAREIRYAKNRNRSH